MTCIIGWGDGDRVLIGGDSAGVSGYDITIMNNPKVFKLGSYVIGFTTSFRMGQLLQYNFTPPEHPEGQDDIEHLVKNFIPALRSCLKEHGFSKIDNNEESGGRFIVGYKGRIYTIESDFMVGIPSKGYDSVGCGYNVALGAMDALLIPYSEEFQGYEILRIMRLSLDIAAERSGGVAPPYVFEEMVNG